MGIYWGHTYIGIYWGHKYCDIEGTHMDWNGLWTHIHWGIQGTHMHWGILGIHIIIPVNSVDTYSENPCAATTSTTWTDACLSSYLSICLSV